MFLLIFFGLRYLKTFHSPELSVWTLPLAFSVKALVAICFIYLYTYILGNGTLGEDAGVFMRESKMLNEVFWESPSAYFKFLTGIGETQALIEQYLPETTHWDIGTQSLVNDNKNLLRIHSLIHFISFNSPYVHAFILSLISLVGLKLVYLTFENRVTFSKKLFFWILILLPGLLFWGSSLLKEPFMILGLGLLLHGLFGNRNAKGSWVIGIIGALLLLGFKSYVLFALIPALVFLTVTKLLPKHKILGSLGTMLLFFGVLFFAFPSQREKTIKRISRKQFDFINIAQGGAHVYADSIFYYFTPMQIAELEFEGDSVMLKHDMHAQILKLGQIDRPIPVYLRADGSKWFVYFKNDRSNGFIPLTKIDNSYGQLFNNIPEALINALLRPFPNDPGSSLKYLAFLETLLIFGMLGFAFLRRKKLEESDQITIITLLIFIVSLSLFIGWITPVVGAIARYRIPVYLSIFLISATIIGQKNTKHE